MSLYVGLRLRLRDSGERVRTKALATWFSRFERDLHRRINAVVLQRMFLEFIPPSAAILALVAFERLVVQVNALVSHQVALLDERATAHGADVAADAHV